MYLATTVATLRATAATMKVGRALSLYIRPSNVIYAKIVIVNHSTSVNIITAG